MTNPARYFPALVAAVLFVAFARLWPGVTQGQSLVWVYPWLPTLDIEMAFRLDSLALLFALLITGVGAMILSYAAYYFASDRRCVQLQWLLSLFALSMLGLVLADDAITLFLFWEGTTLTSFLLVGFDHHLAKARRNAVQALLITGMGGLALLAALILAHLETGTWRLSEWNAQGLQHLSMYPLILFCLVIGCTTKSAQFPFHFWLPNAMAAPTPVSAYLHSATMVKAGVYLLLRLSPAMSGESAWHMTLITLGGITMLLGALWALRQVDLKLMMAHTTVMALGALVLLIGIGTEAALLAACVFILVHALYKAALFLTVGMLDKKAGTRDVTQLSGLGRRMPLAWACAALGGLSMAGIPPLLGFLGKELIYAGTLSATLWVTLIALIANAMMVVTALAVAWRPFTGQCSHPQARDAHPMMVWGPLTLGLTALVLGSIPNLIDTSLINGMLSDVTLRPQAVDLYLWHGINGPLLLSLATYGLGALLYWQWDRIRAVLSQHETRQWNFDRLYQGILDLAHRVAARITYGLQNGQVSSYLRTTFAGLALTLWAGILVTGIELPDQTLAIGLADVAVLLLGAVGVWVVVTTNHRMLAITSLGAVGAAVSIVFVMYGAIDVAMTQLLVDTLMVVFIALALFKLPRVPLTPYRHWGAGIIACALGLAVTLGLLGVLHTPMDLSLAQFFGQNALSKAFGQNVVNVILVDFRAFDTLGEIAVVVIAATAAIAVIRAKPQDRSL